MRIYRYALIAVAVFAMALPAEAQQAKGEAVMGGDLCKINRGEDQLRMSAGTPIQVGDIIKCIGRETAKAFLDGTLVQFGPLSETTIEEGAPLTLTIAKGSVRATSQPGKPGAFILQSKKSRLTSQGGDAVVRYNAASEFTEVLNLEGRATVENVGYGASGSVQLDSMESTLLTPESAPTQPSPVAPRETGAYTRALQLESPPLPNGDLLLEIKPILDEMAGVYDDVRREIARPSLPQNAPFRLFDSRRQAYALPFFDVPGREAAEAGADIQVEYSIEAPKLRP